MRTSKIKNDRKPWHIIKKRIFKVIAYLFYFLSYLNTTGKADEETEKEILTFKQKQRVNDNRTKNNYFPTENRSMQGKKSSA